VPTYSNFTGLGYPRTITDPNGNLTTYTYDARGQLLTSTQTIDGASQTTTFEYHPLGGVKKINRPDASTESRSYLANGRLSEIYHNAGTALEADHVKYSYNALGGLSAVSNYRRTFVPIECIDGATSMSAEPNRRSQDTSVTPNALPPECLPAHYDDSPEQRGHVLWLRRFRPPDESKRRQ
jgi:YD repeat-containing protein